jgi:hypothetical protein
LFGLVMLIEQKPIYSLSSVLAQPCITDSVLWERHQGRIRLCHYHRAIYAYEVLVAELTGRLTGIGVPEAEAVDDAPPPLPPPFFF